MRAVPLGCLPAKPSKPGRLAAALHGQRLPPPSVLRRAPTHVCCTLSTVSSFSCSSPGSSSSVSSSSDPSKVTQGGMSGADLRQRCPSVPNSPAAQAPGPLQGRAYPYCCRKPWYSASGWMRATAAAISR